MFHEVGPFLFQRIVQKGWTLYAKDDKIIKHSILLHDIGGKNLMNMTKTFKKVGVLAIVLLMIAALVGCGGNQEEKQWEEDVTAIMNDITLSQTDFNTALAGIQPGDADSQTAMLNAIDTLEEDFNALKAVEAPEKYQAVQEEFNTAVDKALEGTAAFREMANNLGDGGDLTIVSDKLSEGQTKYEEFLELWQTAVNNLAEIAG